MMFVVFRFHVSFHATEKCAVCLIITYVIKKSNIFFLMYIKTIYGKKLQKKHAPGTF